MHVLTILPSSHTWFPDLAEWISDETLANLTIKMPEDRQYE